MDEAVTAGTFAAAAAVARRGVGLARRAGTWLMQAPDPYLHDARRRRARAQIPATVREVMVICYGNICRSPFAAVVLERELGPDGLDIRSAGFYGPNRNSPDHAIVAARSRGFDLTPHRSMLATAETLESADVIVVMEHVHRQQLESEFNIDPARIVMLGDFDPEPISMRAVPDPYGGTVAVFERCYERIERCARDLAAAIRARGAAGDQIQPRTR